MTTAHEAAYRKAQEADDRFQELCDQFGVDRYSRVQVDHTPQVRTAHREVREASEALRRLVQRD